MWKKQFVISAVLMVRKTENQTTTLSADEDVDNFLYDAVFYLRHRCLICNLSPSYPKTVGIVRRKYLFGPRPRTQTPQGLQCRSNVCSEYKVVKVVFLFLVW